MLDNGRKESRHLMIGNGHTKKGRDVDVRNANEMRTVEEAKREDKTLPKLPHGEGRTPASDAGENMI